MSDVFSVQRERMVQEQIYGRGVRDGRVLEAMRSVKRELFVPEEMRPHAYEDRPLPIAAGQTISQPYIVAFMVEALELEGGEKVLEIGAGSGYAAAVLAGIAGEVWAIERIGELAEIAAGNLKKAGVENVHVIHADGTKGWPEAAPYDAILVSAGSPAIPQSLKDQLKVGGRLVVPVGKHPIAQELIRLTRRADGGFDREDLADVRFVPLIGREGWPEREGAGFGEAEAGKPRVIESRPRLRAELPALIAQNAVHFESVEEADLDALIERAGEARIVLLGEASHGTSEFYRMRDLITRRLIAEKGFDIVAVEADWPDAARIDDYVRHVDVPPSTWQAFARFPTWMWRNAEVKDFVDWLHEHNRHLPEKDRAGFYGLDMYSLYNSASRVIEYLDGIDPELAQIARERYGCLSPWESDPAAYGHAALTGKYRACEDDVVAMLVDLFRNQQKLAAHDGEKFLDAALNAKLVADAEKYYRVMYYGSRASWNLRDQHMYDTLKTLLDFRGPDAKAVIWAHNSHIGDARHTEMSARGELNIGQLVREGFEGQTHHIGFGTDRGTVAAASTWEGQMEIKAVRPSHPQSFERQFHLTGAPGLILPMTKGADGDLAAALANPRLERAIGVIYRPETELASHYFEARLSRQFDDYIWIDETRAVKPLDAKQMPGLPDLYPFGV